MARMADSPHTSPFGPMPSTPRPPDRYPNLETPSQVVKSFAEPRKLRRTPSGQQNSAALLRLLQKTFKKESFRGRQLEIVNAAVSGADVLVVAPTGAGKSICFQLPAMAELHGITIVISPLLSLMKNQTAALKQLGIKVLMMSHEATTEEKAQIHRELASGHPSARLLYLTPESFNSVSILKSLKTVYQQNELRRLIVDEAHCISEWGPSFRPEYRQLGFFRNNFPSVPIMALTASATTYVQSDIIQSLRLSSDHLFRCVEPFNRPNLFYEVRYCAEPDPDRALDIAKFIVSMQKRAKGQTVAGIVYCRTKASCDNVCDVLRKQGVSAALYHKGIPAAKLDMTMQQWVDENGPVDCIVATVAFGMGIDKPNVRYVVHYDLPKSFEGFYQETGRAGRDGHASKCVLYYSREDATRLRKLVEQEKRKGVKKDTSPSERGVDSFKTVQHYAERTKLCRHVAICRFFGEKIDEKDRDIAKRYCDGMCDVCKDSMKVQIKAQKLTEEFDVASQRVTSNEDLARQEEPVRDPKAWPGYSNVVEETSFYGKGPARNPRPLLAADIANRRSNTAGPSTPAKTQKATAPSPYNLSAGIRSTAQISSSGRVPWARPKAATPVRLGRELEKDASDGNGYTYRSGPSRELLDADELPLVRTAERPPPPAFKTPFMTTTALTPTQRGKRKLDSSSSLELEWEMGKAPQVLATYSQKIPMQLRNGTLQSLLRLLARALGQGAHAAKLWQLWSRHEHGDELSQYLVEVAKEIEFDIMSLSISADGYSDRVQRHLKALKFLGVEDSIEWLQRPVSPSDDEDFELEALRSMARILARPSTKRRKVDIAFNAEHGEVWGDGADSDGTEIDT